MSTTSATNGATQLFQTMRCAKVPTKMFRDSREVARHVARIISDLIREKNKASQRTVLGLATGSTPIGVYRELVRMYNEEGLDFSRVVTFNLDEYWPMTPDSIHSYHSFMSEHLFSHINIRPDNVHIPSGQWRLEHVEYECEKYERMIEEAGGLDLQLLGIGRDGHIGFNEPGSDRVTRTRLVALDPMTRRDAAGEFGGEERVPTRAITMGVGTILSARRIILMALGEHKAWIIRKTVEGEPTSDIPASFLQRHLSSEILIDEASAASLTDTRTPWRVRPVDWTPELQKHALIWLSQECRKPLLKLETKDFLQHQLYDLVHAEGGPEAIRERVFKMMMNTICLRPGGDRPIKVLIFSPHPDDDMISMGGTFITLVNQGHELHVAYMTSGNIAVRDDSCLRHIDFVAESTQVLGIQHPEAAAKLERCRVDLHAKSPGSPDSIDVLELKSLVRKTEAVAAGVFVGLPAERLYFLDLPFYHTGTVKKKPMGDADIQIVANKLRLVRPDQIYFAGDLSDPHGTHRVCAQIIIEALKRLAAEGYEPEVWMYRGAWQEYEPHEIERAVPVSPEITLKKKLAIFKHESQKDGAMFLGGDTREFWIRAEERTKQTAQIYNELGLPEFYALEGFLRYRGQKL